LAQTEQPPSQPCIQLDRNECAMSVRFTFHLVHGRTGVAKGDKTPNIYLVHHLRHGTLKAPVARPPHLSGNSSILCQLWKRQRHLLRVSAWRRCSDPACGGNLFQGSTRPTIQAASGSSYGNLTTCQCESGWGGVGCNGTSALTICSINVLLGTRA